MSYSLYPACSGVGIRKVATGGLPLTDSSVGGLQRRFNAYGRFVVWRPGCWWVGGAFLWAFECVSRQACLCEVLVWRLSARRGIFKGST